MTAALPGLHHVTAISGPPEANLAFYVGTMRRRLVKRTVNFDAPDTYHLYYADAAGTPGSILTFFPFVDAGPGRAGPGMASAVAYASDDLDAEMGRLAEAAVDFDGPFRRFGTAAIALRDPDGLRVEIVAEGGADRLHSVTLWLDEVEPTAGLLERMGYGRAGTETTPTGGTGGVETRLRMRAGAADGGTGGAMDGAMNGPAVIDLMTSDAPAIGRRGAGTVHHVAFRAPSPDDQRAWRDRLLDAGLDVTPVIDRRYFHAIYFRTPGGVLFEIATDPPGFTVDEDPAHLGEALKLPPDLEPRRERLERILPPLAGATAP